MKLTAESVAPCLAADGCLRLHDARGTSVRAISGVLWITQEGDYVDHFVEPGDCFVIEHAGLTVVSAMTEAEFFVQSQPKSGGVAPRSQSWMRWLRVVRPVTKHRRCR